MQYTKYFSGVIKNKGIPHFNQEQFIRMMNIVHIEGIVQGLNKAKQTYKGTNLYNKYDIAIFKQDKVLTDLTGNINPEMLVGEMLIKSKFP